MSDSESIYVLELKGVVGEKGLKKIGKGWRKFMPDAKLLVLKDGAKLKCLRGPSQLKRIPKAMRREIFGALKEEFDGKR